MGGGCVGGWWLWLKAESTGRHGWSVELLGFFLLEASCWKHASFVCCYSVPASKSFLDAPPRSLRALSKGRLLEQDRTMSNKQQQKQTSSDSHTYPTSIYQTYQLINLSTN
jgi:hypothetical protein